jgi:hypothetical protein
MDQLKRIFKKVQAIDTSEMPPAKFSQSSDPTKTKDLLAFRTITTMLSFIQSPSRRLPPDTGTISTDRNDRRELKVLDALSTVLIREHEITAVVALPYNNGSNLQVFASVVHPSNSANSNDRGLWGLFCNFTATLNSRASKIFSNTDSLLNETSLPLIGDDEDKVPRNLITTAKENAPLLDVFLQSHW